MTTQELLAIIYRHYPRDVAQDNPYWKESPEHLALKEAVRKAAADRRRFLDMLIRFRAMFPGCEVIDNSLHLPAGWISACYPGILCLPNTPDVPDHRIGFQVSFLAPYYVLYSERHFHTDSDRPSILSLAPDNSERRHWDAIAREIESTYEVAPMPPAIGHIVVPDVQPGNRHMGEAMIYDCFFDDCPRLMSHDDSFALELQK